MSRTWKRHTHHAGRNGYGILSGKAKKHGIRSMIKAFLKNFTEDSNVDLDIPVSAKKSSSSYFFLSLQEKIAQYHSAKATILNGASPTWMNLYIFGPVENHLISKICEFGDITISDNNTEVKKDLLKRAICEIPEDQVEAIIKAEYAAKGIIR